MWIGTFFGGVSYTSLTENNFHYLIADNGKQYLKGKAISNIIKDKKRSFVVCIRRSWNFYSLPGWSHQVFKQIDTPVIKRR